MNKAKELIGILEDEKQRKEVKFNNYRFVMYNDGSLGQFEHLRPNPETHSMDIEALDEYIEALTQLSNELKKFKL